MPYCYHIQSKVSIFTKKITLTFYVACSSTSTRCNSVILFVFCLVEMYLNWSDNSIKVFIDIVKCLDMPNMNVFRAYYLPNQQFPFRIKVVGWRKWIIRIYVCVSEILTVSIVLTQFSGRIILSPHFFESETLW